MVKLDDPQPQPKKHHDTTGPKSQLRGRELIYVDIDDDITSIVGKIKQAEGAVVALVPPKRIGVLQSVVNLKLLQRAAKSAKKHLAIVTTDPALMNLAGGLAIPVAKNINAQAKVLDMADDDEISDVINGDDLDADAINPDAAEDKDISAAVAAIETDDKIKNDLDADGVPDDEETDKPRPKKSPKSKIKVPNANDLRKKVLIGAGIAIVLIVFLVWALVLAPGATITIKAKTSPVEVSQTLSLVPSSDLNPDDGVMSPVVKQKKSNESVQFDATGTKDKGDKAKGKVVVCNKKPINTSLTSTAKNVVNLPAGTRLLAGNLQFVTDADISVPGYSDDEGSDEQRVCVSVRATAANIGSEYNIGDGTLMQVSGYDQASVAAQAEGDFTGGSKQTVKVVQQSDVDAAIAKLKERGDSDEAKDELKDQMAKTTRVIDGSFTVNQSDVKVSPAVGEEASGQASASMEITYTLVGVDEDDLKQVLDAKLADQINQQQKVYDDGLKDVRFSNFRSTDRGYAVTVKASGHVGPSIDEDEIRQKIAGKKTEEIRELIKQTDGVSDVDVSLSPFWVSKAPAANKIKINFTIDE